MKINDSVRRSVIVEVEINSYTLDVVKEVKLTGGIVLAIRVLRQIVPCMRLIEAKEVVESL